MEENFALFDFCLTDDEMCGLEMLDLGKSQFLDHCAPEVAEMYVRRGQKTGENVYKWPQCLSGQNVNGKPAGK